MCKCKAGSCKYEGEESCVQSGNVQGQSRELQAPGRGRCFCKVCAYQRRDGNCECGGKSCALSGRRPSPPSSDILSPFQGYWILDNTSIPGWRARGALTLGYFISRFQREKRVRAARSVRAGMPALRRQDVGAPSYDGNPRFFISASTFGSRPRKARYASAGSTVLPIEKIFLRKRSATFLS